MTNLRLTVDAMGCGACVRRVTQAINSVAGAKAVDVSIGKATVACDLRQTSVKAVIDAVTNAGYPAHEEAGHGS